MNKILINMLAGLVALHFALITVGAYAAVYETNYFSNNPANEAAKANYKVAKERATATYKAARARCDVLSGNQKDVCLEEAKAVEKISKADAQAQYENTPKAKMKARLVKADANYAVAREKCSAHSGNAKDVCIKEAKAAQTNEKADAKSSKEIGEIKSDAEQEKRDAEYKVAAEKCGSLAGPTKDACIATAKSKYGK